MGCVSGVMANIDFNEKLFILRRVFSQYFAML